MQNGAVIFRTWVPGLTFVARPIANRIRKLCFAPELLIRREPPRVDLLVGSIFVDREYRFVDFLAQITTLRNGDSVLFRPEKWTDDLHHALPLLRCPVLKDWRIENDGLHLAFAEHPDGLGTIAHVDKR